MYKAFLAGLICAFLLPLQVLAEEPGATTERTMTIQAVQAPYVLDAREPLRLSGKVFKIATGLIHLDTDAGSHVILPANLPVEVNGARTSASLLKDGDAALVEIPLDHVRVMQFQGDVPYAGHFKSGRVLLLGSYPGVIWMPESLLASADVEKMTVFTDDGQFELSVAER